jgi:hypothetical protein
MFWMDWFGTGNKTYETRFGQLERRLLRRTLRLRYPVRALARSAALSAQEMDHWLFLNQGSLFRDRLEGLSADQGRRIFLTWFAACLAALRGHDELPDPGAAGWQAVDRLVRRLDPAGGESPLPLLEAFADQAGTPRFPAALLESLRPHLDVEPDLEQTLTFGILTEQMLRHAVERCHRLL